MKINMDRLLYIDQLDFGLKSNLSNICIIEVEWTVESAGDGL